MAQTTVEQASADGSAARTAQRASLNKQRYISEEFADQEWRRVWSMTWLFAGLVADVPDPGDYFVYEVGAESIVVLRGDDGQLHAFYNVCQHRGNRIFSNPSGSVQQIACPYHGWRYHLDGQLAHVPDAERFCPPPTADKQSLKSVKVEIWAGLVWLNMDPESTSLIEFLGPVAQKLAPYHFENMRLVKHQTVALDANWKTLRDNFLEQYHVDFIHPQHAGFVDCCNSTNTLFPLGHSSTMVEGFVTNSRYPVPEQVPEPLQPFLQGLGMTPADFEGRVVDVRSAVQRRKRELGAELGLDYSELSDDQLSDVWQYDIFPNTFMTIHAEELWIYGPRPHASNPDKCYFDKFTLQVPRHLAVDEARGIALHPALLEPQPEERPEQEVFGRDEVLAGEKSLTITIDQDIYYLPDMQAGMHSKGFECAVLNKDEVRIQHFHDWVDAWLEQGS